jgi:RHS repeat-associated protein
MVDYGGTNRVRFRYVGLTTSAAQTIDDQSGSVLRNIGTGWGGERQLDWTGTNSNIRYYGTNAHHDTVWTASSTGTVSATLRYDPFGTLTTSTGSSLPDFRFQGSWFDTATSLQWVVTRWYAPALGRFLTEDSLLGSPADPPSRHLYAYSVGEPVARWDPDGRFWYKVKRGDTLWRLAAKFLHNGALWKKIYNRNRSLIRDPNLIRTGWCISIPVHRMNRCLRPPDTDTGPEPGPHPSGDCEQNPNQWFCHDPVGPAVDPLIRGIKAVNTVGVCQGESAGAIIFGIATDLCAIRAGSNRAITVTVGAGIDIGGHLNAGLTWMISTGHTVHDQCCWFVNRGGEAALGAGVTVNIADWGDTTNVEFGAVGGVGLSVRAGLSYTFTYDNQFDIDSYIAMFPLANPWAVVDRIWDTRNAILSNMQS